MTTVGYGDMTYENYFPLVSISLSISYLKLPLLLWLIDKLINEEASIFFCFALTFPHPPQLTKLINLIPTTIHKSNFFGTLDY